MACGTGGNEELKEEGKEDGRKEMEGFACSRGLFSLRPFVLCPCVYLCSTFFSAAEQQREKENRNQKTAARL